MPAMQPLFSHCPGLAELQWCGSHNHLIESASDALLMKPSSHTCNLDSLCKALAAPATLLLTAALIGGYKVLHAAHTIQYGHLLNLMLCYLQDYVKGLALLDCTYFLLVILICIPQSSSAVHKYGHRLHLLRYSQRWPCHHHTKCSSKARCYLAFAARKVAVNIAVKFEAQLTNFEFDIIWNSQMLSRNALKNSGAFTSPCLKLVKT